MTHDDALSAGTRVMHGYYGLATVVDVTPLANGDVSASIRLDDDGIEFLFERHRGTRWVIVPNDTPSPRDVSRTLRDAGLTGVVASAGAALKNGELVFQIGLLGATDDDSRRVKQVLHPLNVELHDEPGLPRRM